MKCPLGNSNSHASSSSKPSLRQIAFDGALSTPGKASRTGRRTLFSGRVKFRVGQIVYLAFSRDEALMGFAFLKEEREAALETYPNKFVRPRPPDMRFQWLVVRLDAIDESELRELVFDAWRMVVPKKLSVLS